MMRFTHLQQVLILAIMPFYLLWLAVKLVAIMKVERNGYKTDAVCNSLTALKGVELIPDLDLNDVKKRAKELTTPDCRVTINDVI